MESMLMVGICLLFVSLFHTGHGEYKRVCYFTNWAQYRKGIGNFQPSNIDPALCTHIIYAFGKLEGNTVQSLEWNDYQLYEQINKIKKENPTLKTLLAMGGWTAGSVVYSNMVGTSESRAEFIESSINYLRLHGFDGLDIDWEYPANRGGLPSDKENFGILVKELRTAFENEAAQTGLARLLLTAAVAAGKYTIDSAYDVQSMADNMDFISIMSYDLHGSWDRTTGHNSPLFPRSSEYGSQRYLNIEYAANYWNSLGASRDKLIIGLATYGRSFTLSGSQTGIGAPASGAGVAGTYTREAGFLSYYEICQKQESGVGWTVYDNEQKVPYYTDGSLWVGFDDEISLAIKVEWLVSQGYGGAMIWSLALDDFNQVCSSSKRRFPLINTIKDLLVAADNGAAITTPALPTGISSAAPPPSTTGTTSGGSHAGGSFSCGDKVGVHADPTDCSKFFICERGTAFSMSCPGELLFNSIQKYCDYTENVICITSSSSSPFSSLISTTPIPPSSSSQTVKSSLPSSTSLSSTSKATSSPAQTSPILSSTLSTTSTTFSTPTTITTIPTTTVSSTSPSTSSSSTTILETTVSTVTTTAAKTPQSIRAFEFCKGNAPGFYSDPVNCNQFYYCYGFGAALLNCQKGLYFNSLKNVCDYPNNVQCSNEDISTDTNNLPTTVMTTTTTQSSSTHSTTVEAPTSPTSLPSSTPTTIASSTSSPTTLQTFMSSILSTTSTLSTTPTSETVQPTTKTNTSSIESTSISTTTTPPSTTDQPYPSQSSSQSVISSTSELQTTSPSNLEFCRTKANGEYAHPSDCSKYITCFNSMQYVRTCPSPLLWNRVNEYCDWSKNVICSR